MSRARLTEITGKRDFRVLGPGLVTKVRAQLLRQVPGVRVQHRLLEFAPLVARDLPSGIDVPGEFLAVRFEFGAGFPLTDENRQLAVEVLAALSRRAPVVVLAPPEFGVGLRRFADVHFLELGGVEVETAVIARAQGFVGTYGSRLYLAVLLGVPAVGLSPARDEVVKAELRLAEAFLARPPFGRLHLLEVGGAARETARQAADVFEREAALAASR
jgi:hypothetical protein